MIPPLAMDVTKDDVILDMCAAPGSKTSQIIEMMYHGVCLWCTMVIIMGQSMCHLSPTQIAVTRFVGLRGWSL